MFLYAVHKAHHPLPSVVGMLDYILDFRLRKNQANYRETVVNQVEQYSRCLPSFVMDLAFPAHTILGKSDIKHLRLIEHLMVETQDSLVFGVRGLRRLGWCHDEVFEIISMWSTVFLIIGSDSAFDRRRPKLLGDEARSMGGVIDG